MKKKEMESIFHKRNFLIIVISTLLLSFSVLQLRIFIQTEPRDVTLEAKFVSFFGNSFIFKSLTTYKPRMLKNFQDYFLETHNYQTKDFFVKDMEYNTIKTNRTAKVYFPNFDQHSRVDANFLKQKLKVILYIHEGGLIFSKPENYGNLFRQLISSKKGVVVVPDYLKFPDAKNVEEIVEDCYEALSWSLSKFGYGKKEIMLIGAGRGGNIVLELTQLLRDRNYELIDKQNIIAVTIYSDICSFSKMGCPNEIKAKINQKLFNNGLFINKRSLKSIGENRKSETNLFENLEDLPTTINIAVEHDFLRTEEEEYIKELNKIDGKGSHAFIKIKNETHGFLMLKECCINPSSKIDIIGEVLTQFNGKFSNKKCQKLY